MSYQQSRTKTVRCRYFDDSGRPLKPKCNQGELCSYAHPDDLQWSFALLPSRNNTTPDAHCRSKPAMSSPAPSRRVIPPLTPQSEVFKRAVPEKDAFFDLDDRRQIASRSYEKRSYLGVERPDDRHPEKSSRAPRVFDERVKVKEEETPRSPPKQPRAHDLRTQPRNRDLVTTSPVRNGDSNPQVANISQKKMNIEAVIELFRKLAKSSNKVMQATVTMERESQKLETYTELSSTLAKVSTSAAASVAPALANIVQNRALYEAHVEEELNALSHIWEDVFQAFVRGVGNAMDVSLQEAISTLKKEGEKVCADVQQIKDRDRKKRREEDDDRTERDRKRRRIELEDGQVLEKSRVSSRPDNRIGDMYVEMKLKLDRQAQKLDQLTKENSELKTVLRRSSDAPTIKESLSDGWSERCPDESVDSGTSLWERLNQNNKRGR